MKTKMLLVLGSVACLTMPVGMAQTRSAADLYQEALHLQEVKGDLTKAIEIYRTILDRYAADQVIAPEALLEMASDYEKLGKPEAADVYQRIVREYAASGSVSAAAQGKLATLSKTSEAVAVSITALSDGTVSPDGRYSSFTDGWGDLMLRDLSSGRERHLTECWKILSLRQRDKGCSVDFTAFSPDSRLIAYGWVDFGPADAYPPAELRIISRDGGQPRVVYRNKEKAGEIHPFGWTPDGKWILAERFDSNSAGDGATSDLMLIPLDGGEARHLKHFERGASGATRASGGRPIVLSPDGRFAVYDVPTTAGAPERDLMSISIETRREALMFRHPADDYMLAWFPQSDRILFGSDRSGTYGIWSTRVADGRAQGEPMLVRANVQAWSHGLTKKGDFYCSITDAQRDRSQVYIATLDPTTNKLAGNLARLEGRYTNGMELATWSPNGDRLAYVQTPPTPVNPALTPQENASARNLHKMLVIYTMATGELRPLPLTMRNINNPVWLPDGRNLIIQGADLEGVQGLFTVNVDTGAAARLQRGGQPAVSPDGRRVFFSIGASGTNSIVSRDLTSGAEQTITTQGFNQFAISPDGRWLAATTTRYVGPKRPWVFVIPSSGGEPRPLSPVLETWELALAAAWTADGRSVYVVKRNSASDGSDLPDEIWQVPIDGSEPRSTGISWPAAVGDNIRRISVHPDGRRLAISTTQRVSESWVLHNLPPQRDK